jgi:hypothetical protein
MPSAIGSRTSASNLWMLRNADSHVSNVPRSPPANGGAIALWCPVTMMATPISSVRSRNVRSGRPRRHSPTRPSAARTPVSRMSQGAVDSENPAGSHGRPSTGM